jgi:hypothetical protein
MREVGSDFVSVDDVIEDPGTAQVFEPRGRSTPHTAERVVGLPPPAATELIAAVVNPLQRPEF